MIDEFQGSVVVDQEGRMSVDGGAYLFSAETTWKIAQAIDEGRDRLAEPLPDEFPQTPGVPMMACVKRDPLGVRLELKSWIMTADRVEGFFAWLSRHRDAGTFR